MSGERNVTLANRPYHLHLHEADAKRYSPRSAYCDHPGCQCPECAVVRRSVRDILEADHRNREGQWP